jgi:beta-N-acetylhexosaminidase
MASTIGEQIGELGFNVDFAPVADVKTSELNQEIGSRSFGDDPEKVAKFVSAYVKGLESKDICATLKHFPGQGSASGDTHQGSVDIDSSIASLRKTDFVPFESGIEAGADFIMVSHISVSKVTETSEPASMSKLVMTTILREELDYKGLIITDAFDMASITKYYSAGEAATGAFEAGADIILMPQDLPEAYNAILDKVKSGDISEKRLNDTVQRILQLKYQKGIMSLTDTTKVSNSP